MVVLSIASGKLEGQIVTNALEAELGTVATSEAASGVGLLVGGQTKVWGTLEEIAAPKKPSGTEPWRPK